MPFPFFKKIASFLSGRRSFRQTADAIKIAELSMLYRISQSLAQTLEMDELLPAITQTLADTVDFGELTLSFFDEKREFLEVQAARGFPDNSKIRGMIYKPGKGAMGRAASEKRVILVKEREAEPGSFHNGPFVCVPLIVVDRVLGVMSVGDNEKRFSHSSEIQFLEAVANQIAIAYDRSFLYTKTKELSVTDELTGLSNRRHFQKMLHLELKRAERFGRPLSLLVIDVDHFKSINDTLGHLKGDQILKALARLLLTHVREVDTMARFGGEEFVVLLADTRYREAVLVAEKLRKLIEGEGLMTQFAKETGPLTISVGVSSYPELASSEEELISTADTALYKAKEEGRNRVIGYRPGEVLRPVFH